MCIEFSEDAEVDADVDADVDAYRCLRRLTWMRVEPWNMKSLSPSWSKVPSVCVCLNI